MSNVETQSWSEQRTEHWYAQAWVKAFTDTVELMDLGGAVGRLEISQHDPNPEIWNSWQEPLWIEISCDAASDGKVLIGCAAESASGLVRTMFPDPESEDSWQGTFTELLNQAFSPSTGLLKAVVGRPVEYGQASAGDAPANLADGVELRYSLGDATHAIALVPSPALVQVLSGDLSGAGDGGGSLGALSEATSAPAAPAQEPPPSAAMRRGNDNLELLLEVELDLSISFGKTTLPLGDVLKFSSGSIVELNRSVTDPVEVIVNDSVIARGEVVVVEGNYGIRITEIISRRERIQNAL